MHFDPHWSSRNSGRKCLLGTLLPRTRHWGNNHRSPLISTDLLISFLIFESYLQFLFILLLILIDQCWFFWHCFFEKFVFDFACLKWFTVLYIFVSSIMIFVILIAFSFDLQFFICIYLFFNLVLIFWKEFKESCIAM
jgi:hypothetical protein